MSVEFDFGLQLTPPEPTALQKVKFSRAVMASVGRTSLDPRLKVFTDREGYGAITSESIQHPDGGNFLQKTEVFLSTDGIICVEVDAESAEEGLAKDIKADIARRERKAVIDAYCAETGKGRSHAERVILDHMMTKPTGIRAVEMLIAHVTALEQDETPQLTIDAFAFGDLTERIVRNFVAI